MAKKQAIIYYNVTLFMSMYSLVNHVQLKLTVSRPSRALSTGTYTSLYTQPLILTSIVGTIYKNNSKPLHIYMRSSAKSQIRVFLRYRSIKAIRALKSPKYGRTLKLVATTATSTVFSVNPLSRTNCRRRRTFMQHLVPKTDSITLLTTQYDE